jgi:hypothetical protein
MIRKLLIFRRKEEVLMQKIYNKRTAMALMVILLLGLGWMGCSTTARERREELQKGQWKGGGKYYHFDDVLIPGDLKYKPNKSFVYETPRFKTGVMVFSKWWLDVGSLIEFFTYHMEKDNWKLVNSFRGKESVVNFSKPDKTCAIRIIEKWYGMTEVEIRVGPLGDKKM